ncbi:ABC transporter ATP-binding protein [Salinibacter ruber]|uniref:ABC-type multidrug transport system fused ATPase/permease subunit n=1 Tax=Salinibacter ruber TaxID=146919 RepID=A0A9X2TGM2_9BACT|nr:ABC transporter ATP-binding protein [Salinibacter ruber]MCS3662078.1 ABC-type multidrug transport system fused ATPase/permease subunit [Salinibacter ruber]MCS3711867.1 ABC-type multidrug transport system fused ATPase/permease subunit [Salinibacter ruber]
MNTFGDLLKYLKIYRRYLGRRMYLVFVLAVATALAQGFGITLLLPLLRASQSGGDPEDMGTAEQYLQAMLETMGIADSMVGILAFIAIVFVGKGALQFAKGGYQGYLQAQLLRELKTKLFDAYSGMDYRYYISQNTGHFINVINGQVNRFFMSFSNFVGFLTQIITTASYFAFAFALTWKFASMALGIGAIMLFLFKYLNTYVRRLSRQQSQEMSTLNKLLVQSLQAFKYIVATNQTGHLRSGVLDSVRRLTGYIFRQRIAGAFTGALKEPVSVLLIVGLIALQVAVFEAPIAPIFVALLLFHRGMQAMISVQSGWQSTMNKIGAVEMVSDEFEAVQDRQEPRGGREIGPLSQAITFHDVCFAYNEEDGDVLHDIDVTVPANTTVALVGESGAGKSTLVDMMTLMLKPRTGTVTIDGVPHDEVDLASWRDQIGYVSQETVVFDDTVANNISLWRGDIEEDPALRDRVIDAAERAHADHFIRDLPNGYQTVVGDRGVRLSGGQRQRLFVARELFKQPNLLLLDEATSDLDTASEQHIQDSIDALKGEVTVVIIAHRLSTVKNADRVYVLEEGRVIEEGSYDELRMRENGEFREMVEMQSV